MVFARRSTTLLAAIIASCAMVLSLTACTSDNKTVVDGQTTVTSNSAGGVAVFTPSDGITLNQQTPLNKWAKLVPDLAKALADAGFKKGDIDHTTSDSLAKQSRAIQDFVVDHLSNNTTDDSGIAIAPDNMTLLVAPVVEADASTRQYGDYVSQNLSTNDATDGEATSDGESSEDDSSKDDSSNTESDSTASDEQAQAVDRLVSSLKLAKESGMHVVLLGNSIEGYKPDAFVKFSDAQTIGKLQAEKMVSKLKLDKASKDNPKYIEVLRHTPPWTKKATPTIPRSPKRRSVVSGRYWAPTIRRALWKALQAPWTANPRKTIGKPWPTMPLRKTPLRKRLTSVWQKPTDSPHSPVLTASSR